MRVMPALLCPMLLCPVFFGGCAAPLVVGAAATAGYVGLQDRPSAQVAKDAGLKTRIKGYLADTNYQYLADVGIDVFYGDVLLTGIVPTQKDGEEVASVVMRSNGTRKLYNELFIGSEYTTAQKAKDAWIAAQIQPRLLATNGVFPLNYLITVVNSHVYILGSVGDSTERSHVLHLLRTTKGVVQVHDYLVMKPGEAKNDGRTNTLQPTSIAEPSPLSLPPSVTEEEAPPLPSHK